MAEALLPCPTSPNCVSSRSRDARHAMPPITFSGPAGKAQARLREILERIPRCAFRADRPGYLAVSFRSRVFGFVDDAEFLIDPDTKEIHFRSGARTGYYDFGVNRSRMEHIAQSFRDTG